MERQLQLGSHSSQNEPRSGSGLSVSTRYNGFLFDQCRNTYYRILSSAGNPEDSGFPTDTSVRRLQASIPCPIPPAPGENCLGLGYRLGLRSSGAPEALESMMRCRVRCLKQSSKDCSRRPLPSLNSLVCEDRSGIVSFCAMKTGFMEIQYQHVVREPGHRLSFDLPQRVMTDQPMSEAVWKKGAPLNEFVVLQNAPIFKPRAGVGVSVIRLGNGSPEGLNIPFRHRLSLRGHAQGLAVCPSREIIIFGQEGESVAVDIATKKTYQVSYRNAHCHLFHEDSLFVGGLRHVQHFDLRQSLRRYTDTFRLGLSSLVAKRMLFLPRQGGLLVGCAGGQVTQWDPRMASAPVAIFNNSRGCSYTHCAPLHVDEAERFLTCVDIGHGTHVWDLRTARLLRCIPDNIHPCTCTAQAAEYWSDDGVLCTFSSEHIHTYLTRPSEELLPPPLNAVRRIFR